jgi:hypothetical protein
MLGDPLFAPNGLIPLERKFCWEVTHHLLFSELPFPWDKPMGEGISDY